MILTVISLLIIMQPWIADWTFDKQDVAKILSFHGLELKNSFKILENESGGLRDYYETFALKISDSDYSRIAQEIRASKNFKGVFADYKNRPSASAIKYDTVEFEMGNVLTREYFSNKKMDNGTFHFFIQLDKKAKQLNYTGSDE
ncbi:hypothetical protein [Niabella soli]|nr:hypothetical protein [Niabella soli]